jgi:hypothetical protein
VLLEPRDKCTFLHRLIWEVVELIEDDLPMHYEESLHLCATGCLLAITIEQAAFTLKLVWVAMHVNSLLLEFGKRHEAKRRLTLWLLHQVTYNLSFYISTNVQNAMAYAQFVMLYTSRNKYKHQQLTTSTAIDQKY